MAPISTPITLPSSSVLTVRSASVSYGASQSTLSFIIPIIVIIVLVFIALCFFGYRRRNRNHQPDAASRDVPLYGVWGFKSTHRPADGSDDELPAYTPAGRGGGADVVGTGVDGGAQVVGGAGMDLGTVSVPPPVYSATTAS
jgi:hypothetical protein